MVKAIVNIAYVKNLFRLHNTTLFQISLLYIIILVDRFYLNLFYLFCIVVQNFNTLTIIFIVIFIVI